MSHKYNKGMRAWFDLPLLLKGMTVISIPLLSILLSLVALARTRERFREAI